MLKFYKSMLTSLCLLLCSQAFGQQISQEVAKAKAQNFFNQSSQVKALKGSSSNASLKLAYESKKGDECHFYVFNSTSADGGYVIVGGDEAAQEILGYSMNGTFDYDRIPANFKWWLSQYDAQIEAAIADVKAGRMRVATTVERAKARRKVAARASVAQLLSTEWDQVAPYNSQIPLYAQGFTGQYALATGCVATAGAQVMKYFNWPESGVGSKTMERTINNITFSADFEHTTYDWNNMQNSYSYDTYTGSAADIAVGTLMYHIGVAIDATYGQLKNGGTSAALKNLAIRLVDTFKYTKGLAYETRGYYNDEAWEDMIYSELANSRPVLYGGQSTSGGHAFVCDGYKDGKFHINWGWNGSHNNYFLLTATSTENALTPNGTGSGGGAAGSSYTGGQEIVIGIQPDYSGNSVQKKKMHTDSYSLSSTNVTLGDECYLNGFVYSSSLFEDDFVIGVKFVNTSNAEDVIITQSRTTLTLTSGQGKSPISFTIPLTLQTGATYSVYPVFIDENGEWADVQLSTGTSVPTITTQSPTGLTLYNDLKVSNQGYISANNCKITFSVKNWSDNSVTKNLVVWVFPENGGNNVDYFYLSNQSFSAGETKDYELSYNNCRKQLAPNTNYYIKLQNNSDGKYLSPSVDIYFRNDLTINYNMTAAGWGTICLPFEADIPEGLTAYNVPSIEGSNLVLEEAERFEMNTPYLLSGTAGTYTFTGPDTPTASNYRNGVLVGNTTLSTEDTPVYAPQGSYVLQYNTHGLGFYKVANADSQKIRQYSAYLDDGTNNSSNYLSIAPDATTIEAIANEPSDAPAYNLNGIRVNNNAKGFVIINGKLIYKK